MENGTSEKDGKKLDSPEKAIKENPVDLTEAEMRKKIAAKLIKKLGGNVPKKENS